MSNLANNVSDLSGPTTTSVPSGSSGTSGENNDFVNFRYTVSESTYSGKDSKRKVGRKFYEVEDITARERRGEQYYYEVLWKGYTKKTWEPRSVLIKDCPNLVNNVDSVVEGVNRRAKFRLGASKSWNEPMNFEINEAKDYSTYHETLKKTLDFFTNNQYFMNREFQRYFLK